MLLLPVKSVGYSLYLQSVLVLLLGLAVNVRHCREAETLLFAARAFDPATGCCQEWPVPLLAVTECLLMPLLAFAANVRYRTFPLATDLACPVNRHGYGEERTTTAG